MLARNDGEVPNQSFRIEPEAVVDEVACVILAEILVASERAVRGQQVGQRDIPVDVREGDIVISTAREVDVAQFLRVGRLDVEIVDRAAQHRDAGGCLGVDRLDDARAAGRVDDQNARAVQLARAVCVVIDNQREIKFVKAAGQGQRTVLIHGDGVAQKMLTVQVQRDIPAAPDIVGRRIGQQGDRYGGGHIPRRGVDRGLEIIMVRDAVADLKRYCELRTAARAFAVLVDRRMLAGRAALGALAVIGKIRMLMRLDRNVGKCGQFVGFDDCAVLAIERAALAQQIGECGRCSVERQFDLGERAAVQDQRTGAVTQGEVKCAVVEDDLTGRNVPARICSPRRCLSVAVEGDRACARRHTLDRAAGNADIDRCIIILISGPERADLAAGDRRRAGDIGSNFQRIDLTAVYRYLAAVKCDRVGDITASGHRQAARRDARHIIVLIVIRLADKDHIKLFAVQVERGVGGNVGPVFRSGRAGERNIALEHDRAAGVRVGIGRRLGERAEELLADLRLRGRAAEGARAVGVQLSVTAEDNVEGIGSNAAQQCVRSDSFAFRRFKNIAACQQIAHLGSDWCADFIVGAAGELHLRVLADGQRADRRIALDRQLGAVADQDRAELGVVAFKVHLAGDDQRPAEGDFAVDLHASVRAYSDRHINLTAVAADVEAGSILLGRVVYRNAAVTADGVAVQVDRDPMIGNRQAFRQRCVGLHGDHIKRTGTGLERLYQRDAVDLPTGAKHHRNDGRITDCAATIRAFYMGMLSRIDCDRCFRRCFSRSL